MDNKDFDMMNCKLIDNYIFRQKNTQMLDDDSYPNGKKYRISQWDQKFVGRNLYTPFHRDDVMKYSKNDLRMTKVGKFNLINFTLIDLKFERMIAEHCSIMNGTFKNVEFFRFCIKGKPLSESYEALKNMPFKNNEYHEYRNIVMNCKFVDCTFMNSYSEHTDWINCKFINCTFINSNLCCEGSQQQNCKFTDCDTMYFKA